MMRPMFVSAALLLSTSAFAQALDCTNRDPEVCGMVNFIAQELNAQVPNLIRQSSSRAAFRPTRIYADLLRLQDAADADGCTLQGAATGTYDVSAGVESWSGVAGVASLGTFPSFGVCAVDPNDWFGVIDAGSFSPGLVVPIGEVVGLHNASGQLAADIDGISYQAGYWHRTSGNRGVYMALLGGCPDSPQDPGRSLDPWFDGKLPSFTGIDFVDEPGVCVGFDFSGFSGTVDQVELLVPIEHSFVGDITLTLASPEGTVVTLMNEPPDGNGTLGNSSDLFRDGPLHFVDGGALPANDIGANGATDPACPRGTTCDVDPLDPLALFDGEDLQGLWTLCASDGFPGADDGVLYDATLTIFTP